MERILPLNRVTTAEAGRVGGKAANLGELLRSGFPVPDGFVVLGEPRSEELENALAMLGDQPVAVRSSALAEDLAEASFAGQYETFLDIRGLESVREAIRRCRASAGTSRVARYREERGVQAGTGIAVLVQVMVPARAAGVAFSANPVTGDRQEAVVSAVRGLGEQLVSGRARAEEWVVREGRGRRRSGAVAAIDVNEAVAVAELARRCASQLGAPQDIEWAIAGGRLSLLQSRPMTALPEAAEWKPPGRGYWMRNLRLGEWLPEPVTPLFEDWLLPRLEGGFRAGNAVDVGIGAGLRQATVNGWYYSTPQPAFGPGEVVMALASRPGTIFRFASALLSQSADPELAERRFFGAVVRRWRDEELPAYRSLVERRTAEVDAAEPIRLFEIVDEVATAAGRQLWCLAVGGGSAWKIEVALARFCRRHLTPRVDLEVLDLLVGLPRATDHDAPHLVGSLDWFRPTLGEMGSAAARGAGQASPQRLDQRREAAEGSCREALAADPELLDAFETRLALAQRYARLREEQAFQLTLGWPLLRHCALRLGAEAVSAGALYEAGDVFFLMHEELLRAVQAQATPDLRAAVAERRVRWERRRLLSPPLAMGTQPKLLERMLGSLELLRSGPEVKEGALRGEPASPGRASGRVRIVRGPEEFDAFQPGEVLVAQATAPAWTPLFARAAAVVTDGGSLAAHASLVAREYAIPAVVATGDATARLSDGQWVTVDGSGGFVELDT